MALFQTAERKLGEKCADLVVCNPFLPQRVEAMREVLGDRFVPEAPVIAWQPGLGLWESETAYPNIARVGDDAARLLGRARERLEAGVSPTEAELRLYEVLAFYQLYRDHGEALDEYIDAASVGKVGPGLRAIWSAFAKEFDELITLPGLPLPLGHRPEHLFACFFQLRRAFYHIFHALIGTSGPAARLRAAVWESVVTHDLRGWSRGLYRRMHDFPTLIRGPSGTGKELVARAVGLSQHIAFDPRVAKFESDFTAQHYPLHLASLSPRLVESELFGHVKGAFTGAVKNRDGWLSLCPEGGAVFLDEVGELTSEIQVKLLRVLQSRTFQRVGDCVTEKFAGKILAATNRDLAAEVAAGRFREDFYYRLCADQITTPSLSEQLAERPEDLAVMVEFICRKVEADLAGEVVAWIEANLGHDYGWPGNFRELEQCVRSYTIRKEYRPLRVAAPPSDPRRAFADDVAHGRLSMAEVERRYCTLVFANTGSYQEAARLLNCDWRTLRAKIDPDFLRALREQLTRVVRDW
jgi:hypothetical protein